VNLRLYNNGIEINDNIPIYAAKNGYFNIIKWCYDIGIDIDSDVAIYCAEYGKTKIYL